MLTLAGLLPRGQSSEELCECMCVCVYESPGAPSRGFSPAAAQQLDFRASGLKAFQVA